MNALLIAALAVMAISILILALGRFRLALAVAVAPLLTFGVVDMATGPDGPDLAWMVLCALAVTIVAGSRLWEERLRRMGGQVDEIPEAKP